MTITYLKKSPKTSSTDDTKTTGIVQDLLKDIEKTREQGCIDLTKKFDGNLSKAFEKSNTKFFVISFTSDWLYPTSENREIVIALNSIGKDVGFAEITSDKGHDSFLLDVPDFLNAIKNFLNTSYNKLNEKRI